MNINQKPITISRTLLLSCMFLGGVFSVTSTHAQEVDEVRWKSEEQVRDLYGAPNTVDGPVGTHASYTLWKYDDFTVAFANNRAFHLFNKDSLTKIILDEDR